jgi:hypothetical protein
MAERIDRGTWVEIHRVVLRPGERAPQIPEDTKAIPLEMRVRGFLAEPAALGDEAEIVTPAGRRLRGTLAEVNPAYAHGFGPPIPELSTIGQEVRAILRTQGPRVPLLTGSVDKREPHPSRRSQKKGPPQGERKLSFENNNRTARPEEPPSSGGVSKGARWRKSTLLTKKGPGEV